MQYVFQRTKLLNEINKYKQIYNQRLFSLKTFKLKWVTGKDALGPEIPIGSQHGHPDDPERNTRTKFCTHVEGIDEPIPEFILIYFFILLFIVFFYNLIFF